MTLSHGTNGRFCRLVAAVIALLVASCATSPPAAAPQTPPTLDSPQVFIEQFALSGRLSVRVGDRLDSVRIEWTREGNKEFINFFSPFGSQLAQVSASSEGATLVRGDQTEYAPTVGALTQSLLGTPIDTALLARWVQGAVGLMSADVPAVSGDRLIRWTVRTQAVRAVDGIVGGRFATRITASEGDTTIRLFVDQFRPL
ncbi:MAG: outer membrane lipoprotein LolB [Burkholderiales bacterium]